MNDPTLGNARLVGRAETVDEWPLVITSKYNIPFLLHKKGVGHVCNQTFSPMSLFSINIKELYSLCK